MGSRMKCPSARKLVFTAYYYYTRIMHGQVAHEITSSNSSFLISHYSLNIIMNNGKSLFSTTGCLFFCQKGGFGSHWTYVSFLHRSDRAGEQRQPSRKGWPMTDSADLLQSLDVQVDHVICGHCSLTTHACILHLHNRRHVGITRLNFCPITLT